MFDKVITVAVGLEVEVVLRAGRVRRTGGGGGVGVAGCGDMEGRLEKKWVLCVHGGAGNIREDLMSTEKRAGYVAGLEAALEVGGRVLGGGGSALDAVEAAVVALEDCALFNAGKGAVYSHVGLHELEASIMDGKDQRAGAVTYLMGVRNPIRLARHVLNDCPHVMLSGEGALEFGKRYGVKMEDAAYFHTDERYKQWQTAVRRDTVVLDHEGRTEVFSEKGLGTVGAVALDEFGHLAAATSTGGKTNKSHGRIGDTPLIGAGNYANDTTCAVSGTGDGEFFIRSVAAFDVHARMCYGNLPLHEATRQVVHEAIPGLGGEGGVIAVDRLGNVSMPFHCTGMFRGYIKDNEKHVGIFKGETPNCE